jgi:hypothetical protein
LTAVSFLSLYVAFFNCSYLSTNIRRPFLLPCDFVAASPVHSYGGNADLIPIIGWPEMNHITITGSYYALIYYRHCNILFLPAKTVTFHPLPSDFTVGLNRRRYHSFLSTFLFQAVLICRQTINICRPFLLPCDFVAASLVYSYGGGSAGVPPPYDGNEWCERFIRPF